MNADYLDLKTLQGMRGYLKLQALWAHEYAQVMLALQRVASKNNESNWRYQAGILKGFDVAIGQLERALLQMEKEGEDDTEKNSGGMDATELLKEIRGMNK